MRDFLGTTLSPMRQLRVGKSDLRGGINRDAVASFSPTLPLRLRWERNEIGSVNRNAVTPVLNAICFIFDSIQPGTTLSGLGRSSPPGPKVAATATLGWRMEPLCGCSG